MKVQSSISDSMEKRSVEDALIDADRRTDVTNLIDVFLDYTNAPNKCVYLFTNTLVNNCISIAPTTYSTEDKLLHI
jgi:formaldehyde-activating enzyme involved in methanogenesis